jgi:SPP1 family predicted phage head-tail adaptor
MSRPTLGQMRHRVVIEEQSRASDGGGGAIVSWVAVDEVWAAILPADGTEGPEAGGLTSRVTQDIWIRARSGLRADMRLRSGARIFDIKAIIDDAGERRFLVLRCEERLP